jgi:CreA protein
MHGGVGGGSREASPYPDKFRLFGPDDKIVVDGFDDPKVQGVACHIARAQMGRRKGTLGVAEDTSDASTACRQIGPINIIGDIQAGELVFDERRSLDIQDSPNLSLLRP